ncbi:MAG: hypothetical protein LBK06_03300 [Planctomycetaceae bacterium]|nr:hypothetical protein [Planctomycetaceae bacterium]
MKTNSITLFLITTISVTLFVMATVLFGVVRADDVPSERDAYLKIESEFILKGNIYLIICETDMIRAEMSSKRLLRYYDCEEDNLGIAANQTFAHRIFPIVKIDVTWNSSDGNPNTIKTVSKPYISLPLKNSNINESNTTSLFLAGQLDAISNLKTGITTRGDLLKQKLYVEYCDPESNVKQKKFVSAVCPFVKVDIEFNSSDKKEKQNTDTIKTISKPYLEITARDRNPLVCIHADFELMNCLGECLDVLERIPPQATRKNILEFFETSGGLNTRKVTRLMFKKNNNINIDVTFIQNDQKDESLDTINRVSEPFFVPYPPID